MAELNDWAKKNSKILILDNGETVDAVYKGYKIMANSYDPDKELVVYKLELTQEGEEVSKLLRTASGKAARFFDSFPVGGTVRITRRGTGPETRYEFVDLNDKTQQAQVGEADEDDVQF